MPWIDDEMKAAIAQRLHDVHGMKDIVIGRIHVDLGPKATRQNVTEQLADSLAEIEQRRRAGNERNNPPRTKRPSRHIRDIVAEIS